MVGSIAMVISETFYSRLLDLAYRLWIRGGCFMYRDLYIVLYRWSYMGVGASHYAKETSEISYIPYSVRREYKEEILSTGNGVYLVCEGLCGLSKEGKRWGQN